jgi:calcineurin-like phosphoesterase family protein
MFNITESPELTVHFMADPHLDHNKNFIWESRGYSSADHHTSDIINVTNDCVRENDILFMIGDLCLNSTPQKVEQYLARIRCKNFWCLWGNHNNPHEKSIYRPERDKLLAPGVRANWVYPVKYKNMVYLGHYHECTVNNQFIVMCHYPFMSWNQLGHGAWMLCGHEHGGLPATRPEATDGKILDLGWDMYHKPLSFTELKKIMDTKSISSVGHHVAVGQPPVLGAGAAGTRPA